MANEAQVRKYLDPEEPDYKAAAAALGAEALPVLESLVREAEPLLASKAAYLASLIPDEQATRVLEQAARSDHATVRVAAAAGLQKRADVPSDLAGELLSDPDAGVRKVAAKAARGRAPSTRRDRGSDDGADDRDTAKGVRNPKVIEGEHGGGFSPDTTDDPERAGGEGGGDVGGSRSGSMIAASGTDRDSGGGGDLGGNVASPGSRSGEGPDGGGSVGSDVGDTATSMHGGGSV
jgi:hypothetical protein